MQYENLSILAAFAAGVVSFFSPCHLPLLPAYLGLLAGSATATQDYMQKNKVLFNSVNFVVGFSAVFVLLGLAASWFGAVLIPYQGIIRRVAGIVILLFGLHLAGIWSIAFLNLERRVPYRPRTAGPGASVLMGMAFAAGWTPCLGPVLGAMIAYAAATGGGVTLFVAFALGMAIPFILAALLAEHLQRWLGRRPRFLPVIQKLFGFLMIIVGLAVFFDRLPGI